MKKLFCLQRTIFPIQINMLIQHFSSLLQANMLFPPIYDFGHFLFYISNIQFILEQVYRPFHNI